ncbi:g7676 [Coccomyxa viridis]|uniref:G7676 protein n=1 Tax=Coccomyxa viridis TaxID=1274662 RepID=A0ABP1FYH0_9CHLO
MDVNAATTAQRWPGAPTSPIIAAWPTEVPHLQLEIHGSPDGVAAVHLLKGINSGHEAEHRQPLLLDLLDAQGRHVTDPVTGVSWADAQGAFLVAAATKSSIHVFTIRRYVLWLLGEVDLSSDSSAPFAEQLCQISCEGPDVAAIHWTQRADGLMCADAGGHVSMYETLMTGSGEDARPAGLKLLWQGQSSDSQALLCAGRAISSPSASAALGSKVVVLWWPPKPEQAQRAEAPEPEAKEVEAPAEEPAVRAEQLRHSAPVLAFQWCHGDLYSDDSAQGGATLLPPSQPALLTMTADGVMRIWVEVTVAPPTPVLPGPVSPKEPPAKAQQPPKAVEAPTKSHFCTSLVIQPPPGAWDVQLAPPRVCWGVPSGPEPATRPELRAAKVLWIVGIGASPDRQEERLLLWAVAGLRGVVIGGRPGSRSASQPRAVLWGEHCGSLIRQPQASVTPVLYLANVSAAQHALSASVIVANDIPMLHVMEAYQNATCHEVSALRHFRLDTVEDDQSMPTSLQLPHSAGMVMPPRQLPAHALIERQLLAHGARITAIRALENQNVCATLDTTGVVIVWQLNPLEPLHCLASDDESSTACLRYYTAIAWLQYSAESSRSTSAEAACLLAAASSEGIRIVWLQRPATGTTSIGSQFQMRTMFHIRTPVSSGFIKWLSQAQHACTGAHATAIMLVGWIQADDRDIFAVWQVEVQGQGWGSQGMLKAGASLVEAGLQYAPIAKVALPNVPNDVAALHFPVPTLAVGCEGRGFVVVSCQRNGGWKTVAQLSPLPLPGAALCPLDPPQLLIAAPGAQLQHQPSLAAPDESGQSLPKRMFQAGGPLAPWSPPAMKAMLVRGRRRAAAAAVRKLLHLLKRLEAALDKTISVGGSEEAASGVSMPSKHMLTWAQEIARAAQKDSVSSIARDAQAQGTPSVPPADSLQAHKQPEHPSEAHASAQGSQGNSGNRDSFAFDASAFGMGASEGEVPAPSEPKQAAASVSSQADPFAFSMGAFGMTLDLEPPLSADSQPQDSMPGTAESAAAPEEPPAAAKDPYAFEMGAFGMGAMSASAAEEAESRDLVGAADDQGGTAEAAQSSAPAQPATHADPYTFDMGAFGMEKAHPSEQPTGDSLQAQALEAQHTSSAAEQHDSIAAPAAQADAFAFDMGAFGMSGMTAPEGPSDLSSTVEDQSSAEGPAEPAPKAAADPFAFDLGAFGVNLPDATEQGADSSRSTASPAAAQASQQDRHTSTQPSPVPAETSRQAEIRPLSAKPQAQQQAQQQKQGDHRQQNQQQQPTASQAAAGSLSLAPPEQEAFDPLTDAELQQLERLLLRAGGLDNGESANGRDEPDEDVEGSQVEAWDTESLGLGALEPISIQHILRVARCLIRSKPEEAALDLPAQRLLASMQVALLPTQKGVGQSTGSEQTGIARSMAGSTLQRGTNGAPKSESGVWEEAGLLLSLSMQDILWAMLAQPASHQALLDACMQLVPADEVVEEKQEPKIDFTYSGQQTLDLGFGPSGSRPAQPAQALSWPRLRQAGVGFWMTDPKQVRQLAEQLAKAQFAAKRDPHDCALIYIALGKKTLLQGLFRSAQHKKQAEFLGRSFDSDKDRAAAAKNAFVLLAQHRPQLAAAFFILGGHLKDAVGVCAHELADPQLAIFVARLLEPKQGALLSSLLAHELLPRVREAEDASGAAAIMWLQGDRQGAVQTLLQSLAERDDARADSTSAEDPSHGLAAETHLLDYLYHCTASKHAELRGGNATLGALCSAAQRSMHALEAAGLPAMALEALSIAKALCQGHGRAAEAMWRARSSNLAALAALWPVLGADSDVGRSQPGWQSQAEAVLGQMRTAGADFDADSALRLLTRHMSLLQPQLPPEDTFEAATPFSDISSRFSLSGGHRLSGSGSRPGGFCGTLYDGGHVLHQLRDKVFAVCVSQAGEWSGEGRPIVAATAHKGLIELEATPAQTVDTSVPSEAAYSGVMSDSSASVKGSVFSALLTDMMEAVRWSGASTGGSPKGSPKAARALLPTTSSSALKPSNSPLSRVSISADKIATSALASHPYRPLYLSGCASGEIFLWEYGAKQAMAGYTPLPATAGAAPPPASGSIFSAPKSIWAIDRPGALAALGNWGQPQSVCFSEGGERFAAIGQGGLAAAWRLDAPQFTRSDSGPLARSDWCHQVMSKRGVDIAYVGGGSSVIAAGGYSAEGGNIALWDTMAALSAGPIASLDHHSSLVTALQVLPGGRLLASSDETGNVAVADLRMLGSTRQPMLWQAKSAGGGVTCLTSGPRPALVSGSREGVITSWAVDSGIALQTIDITQVQPSALQKRLPAKGASFFSEAFRSTRQSAAHVITGLASCPEGIVSCCLDGTLRFHPMLCLPE